MLLRALAEPEKRLQAREHGGQDADHADRDLQRKVDVVLERREDACPDKGCENDHRDAEPDVRAREARREPVMRIGARAGSGGPVSKKIDDAGSPRGLSLAAPLLSALVHSPPGLCVSRKSVPRPLRLVKVGYAPDA